MDATRFMAGPLLGVDSTHGDNGRNCVGAQGNGGTGVHDTKVANQQEAAFLLGYLTVVYAVR
jgi:hypothetical protein